MPDGPPQHALDGGPLSKAHTYLQNRVKRTAQLKVRLKSSGKVVNIRKQDFNEDSHELYRERLEDEDEEDEPAPEEEPTPVVVEVASVEEEDSHVFVEYIADDADDADEDDSDLEC